MDFSYWINGGFVWLMVGILCCVTIVGIPVGLQCYKIAGLVFLPFEKAVIYGDSIFSTLVNILWVMLFGGWMATSNLILGCLLCITIIGIPFGKELFKLAKLSFSPFGARVV